jgi:hypothetical protein
MAFGGWGEGKIGAQIQLTSVPLADHKENKELYGGRKGCTEVVKLFGETGGFVCEVPASKAKKFEAICAKHRLEPYKIGKTTVAGKLVFKNGSRVLINLELQKAADRWLNGLREKLT